MPATLTKADIQFDEFRIYRQTEHDDTGQETVHWYISVGYKVTTQEGETWNRNITEELTGTFKTRARNLLSTVRDYVLQKEGLA